MNYYINHLSKEGQKEFNNIYSKAAERLLVKLKNLNLKDSGISEYNQRYLGEHINDFQKISWFLSHIFMLVYEKNNLSFDNLTIVDYGGGSGILSFLAKEIGVEKVVYNDIYDISCHDVLITSNLLNTELDKIIHGDISEIINFSKTQNYPINFLLAHDVIEHIYDVEEWFEMAQTIMSDELNIICTSHANKYNPLINTKLKKLQRKAETQSRQKVWGHKDRDSLDSFLAIRKNIIAECDTELNNRDVSELAIKTRGLMKQDIQQVVHNYKETGQISYKTNHPTNTCDPLTGNWIEQLIDLYQLEKKVKSMDYSVKLSFGYYIDSKGSNIIKAMKLYTNFIISKLGRLSRFLSPYYIFESSVKSKN